ncbi:MAG: hypothetical protein IK102_02145 [Treponema sp.]|nr:hypothetical protein [Treponema sp.]
MINSKLRQLLVVAGESVLLAGITIASVIPVSCKITEQGIKILSGDYTAPVLNSFTVKDEYSIQLEFSEKVGVDGCVVARAEEELFDSEEHSSTLDLSPALENASGVYGSVPCSVSVDESGCIVTVRCDNQMEIGQTYEFYSKISDSAGNTLTLVIPFSGFNARVPQLLLTEIQSESCDQNKTESNAGIYRNEFVEILVLKGGNLAGLELCSGYDGDTKKYVFPAIDVQAGEVFVVHMRKRGEGCISEVTDNLDQAFASYTGSQVRDLWTDVETTTLGNKTDVIILRNRADGKLLDAVMYRASNIEAWTKTMIEYSQLVDESKIYDSGDTDNAFVTDGLTKTKTFGRMGAAELQQKVLNGEAVEYPVASGPLAWELLPEPSPGTL